MTQARAPLDLILVLDPSKRRAYRLFHASNSYLLTILLAVLLGALIKVP